MATNNPPNPAAPPAAAPGSDLTKQWIQYLKNNKIVKMQSDPKTGKLSYNREVSVNDVTKFLTDTGKFDEDAIQRAIKKAIAGKPPAAPSGTAMPTQPFAVPGAVTPDKDGKLPTQQSQSNTPNSPAPAKQPSQTPNAIRKREQRVKSKTGSAAFGNMAKQLAEDITDTPGPVVDENTIEKIFAELSTPKKKQGPQATKQKVASPEEQTQKKQEEFRKIKLIVRDTMSDAQRKALWRALNDI